jgi:1,4-dihydroxy-2-naphthoyl-CoA hydrolase
MPLPPERFETYDPELADQMLHARALLQGIPEYLGIRTVDVGPGTLTVEMDVREELLNPFGTAHGGVLAAVVDHILGAVLYPVIPRGAWSATTEFKLNLVAPVRVGTLRATSTIESLTKRTAVVRIEAHHDRRLVGLAQGTVTISPPRTEPPSSG